MKLDVLVTTAHPDDAEFSMGGTILNLLSAGKKVGIADFTRGELGTRGNADLRDTESAEADRRFGLTMRVNMGFRDGFFVHDETHVLAAVALLRRFRPDMLFTNPANDRHPDHGRAHDIMKDAVFLAGLERVGTRDDAGALQKPWRPLHVFHYIQNDAHAPDMVVDISAQWDKKLHVLAAYQSQFSGDGFWDFHASRARTTGALVGAHYGEGFIKTTLALPFDPLWVL
jgi:bacillithiol biosynthesis deacetylase BshB1